MNTGLLWGQSNRYGNRSLNTVIFLSRSLKDSLMSQQYRENKCYRNVPCGPHNVFQKFETSLEYFVFILWWITSLKLGCLRQIFLNSLFVLSLLLTFDPIHWVSMETYLPRMFCNRVLSTQHFHLNILMFKRNYSFCFLECLTTSDTMRFSSRWLNKWPEEFPNYSMSSLVSFPG